MYRKSSIILFVMLVLFLTACSSKTVIYTAETDNWSADLQVIRTSNDYETQELKLKYHGEDVNTVGEISYKVDSVGYFGQNGRTLTENGTLRGKSESNPTNLQITEHTEITVTVEWNDQKETWELNKE